MWVEKASVYEWAWWHRVLGGRGGIKGGTRNTVGTMGGWRAPGRDAYSVVIQSLGGHSQVTWVGVCLGDSGSLVCYLHFLILLCCPFTKSENWVLLQKTACMK